MKQKIIDFAKTLHIDYIGVAPATPMYELRDILNQRRTTYNMAAFEEPDIEKRTTPQLTLPGAKSILVALFPYYDANQPVFNISRYACIPDYHRIVLNKLTKICEFIKSMTPECTLMPFVDNGPLADKYLAYLAGLGNFGKNTLLLNEKYGSYLFIGYIITDLSLPADRPSGAPLHEKCKNCGACIKNCPGKALSDHGELDVNCCVSYITQIKETTDAQKEILVSQNSVYGCDICQEVCPQNKNIPTTPILEFRRNRLIGLEKETLLDMSNRAFQRTYQEYPFSWRGKNAILKNFDK